MRVFRLRMPPEWKRAAETILAAWLTLDAARQVHNPLAQPFDEKTLRRVLYKSFPEALAIFVDTHGRDDGQTCRCRIYALLSVTSSVSCMSLSEAVATFDNHKNYLDSYLNTTREVN